MFLNKGQLYFNRLPKQLFPAIMTGFLADHKTAGKRCGQRWWACCGCYRPSQGMGATCISQHCCQHGWYGQFQQLRFIGVSVISAETFHRVGADQMICDKKGFSFKGNDGIFFFSQKYRISVGNWPVYLDIQNLHRSTLMSHPLNLSSFFAKMAEAKKHPLSAWQRPKNVPQLTCFMTSRRDVPVDAGRFFLENCESRATMILTIWDT